MTYYKTSIRMDDHSIIMVISTLVGALGIKEIWGIIKQKIDINAKKDEREDSFYVQQISDLTNKIGQLEKKIEVLIEENIQLRVKVEKMQTRLIMSAKKKVNKKRDEKS
jgi:hypothetical protein